MFINWVSDASVSLLYCYMCMCMCTDTLDSDVGLVAFFGDLRLSAVAVLRIIIV